MKNRELHVPRFRGQATETMGLYVAEDDHDRVVDLLQAESNAWEETAKTFEDFYRKTESELTKARELLQYAYDHSELLPNERKVDAFLIADKSAPAAKGEQS